MKMWPQSEPLITKLLPQKHDSFIYTQLKGNIEYFGNRTLQISQSLMTTVKTLISEPMDYYGFRLIQHAWPEVYHCPGVAVAFVDHFDWRSPDILSLALLHLPPFFPPAEQLLNTSCCWLSKKNKTKKKKETPDSYTCLKANKPMLSVLPQVSCFRPMLHRYFFKPLTRLCQTSSKRESSHLQAKAPAWSIITDSSQ